ncbi:MAG TPA: hypothetical protein VGY13_02175 [Solirubrobacteraceae bacterium]|jgi:hypothetical protein|nr:hypothetical protein [Solirubrobacteraceae bacterium]
MAAHARSLTYPFRRRLALAAVAGTAFALLTPASGEATLITFGSQLSVPATLNTAENLSYQGTNTAVPPSPEAPNGVFHTFHYGADTALWNLTGARGVSQSVPANGQILKVRLEGCAKPASDGPAPLDQIHFQDLSPVAGGGEKVNLTSQSFEIPICGQGSASGATVTSYEPTDLCVSQGDYVAFNDEGGYVENVYRAGVPYEVLGAASGATLDSFIKGDGTGNGAIFAPSETSAMDGFAANANEELMMQLVLGTGANAVYGCPGGAQGAPPVLPVIRIGAQTDGVNHARIIEVAVYCRPASGCSGTATLTTPSTGKSAALQVGRANFDLRGDDTTLMPIRISSRLLAQIRKHHGAATTISAVVGGQTFTQTIEIKIF